MRGSLNILRSASPTPTTTETPHHQPAHVPSIRLISATPGSSQYAPSPPPPLPTKRADAVVRRMGSLGASYNLNDGSSSGHGGATPAPTLAGYAYAPAPVVPPNSFFPEPPLQPKPKTSTSALKPKAPKSPGRKLAPKKSKLSLLTPSASSSAAARANDLSDVVRRVTASSPQPSPIEQQGGFAWGGFAGGKGSQGGFEIYVDAEVDPDVGELVVIKKKKSRLGLGAVGWSAADLTNAPMLGPVPVDSMGREAVTKEEVMKKEEKEGSGRWWTIGRGRKEDKEKAEKEKGGKRTRSKSPGPAPALALRSKSPGPTQATSHHDNASVAPASRPKSPGPGSMRAHQENPKLGPASRAKSPGPISSFAGEGLSRSESPVPFSPKDELPAMPSRSKSALAHYDNPKLSPVDPNRRFNSLSGGTALQQFPATSNGEKLAPSPHPGYSRSISAGRVLDRPHLTPQGQREEHRPALGALGRAATFAAAPAAPAATIGRSATPNMLAVPGQENVEGGDKGSIAVRAMKSMRSLARMGSWANMRVNPDAVDGEDDAKDQAKDRNASKEKSKSKDKRDKEKKDKAASKKDKERKGKTSTQTTSSFEIGMPSPARPPVAKKRSVLGLSLGLGLPSTMRARGGSGASSLAPITPASAAFQQHAALPSALNPPQSSASSVFPLPAIDTKRLSAESAAQRRTSTSSGASSLRPVSVSSGAGSVRWDEEQLERVRVERAERRASADSRADRRISAESKPSTESKADKRLSADSKASKDSKRHLLDEQERKEGRRRTPLTSVFASEFIPEQNENDARREAEVRRSVGSSARSSMQSSMEGLVVRVEEATADGHDALDEQLKIRGEQSEWGTPKRRSRPVSEQLLGQQQRPKAMYEEGGDGGVLSMLDAATNDLAQLINHLDLEATPGTTPDRTPNGGTLHHRPSIASQASPVKKRSPQQSPSITSLRPYAQSRSPPKHVQAALNANVIQPRKASTDALKRYNADANAKAVAAAGIGQPIKPWTALNEIVAASSPPTPPPRAKVPPVPAPMFRATHKRTQSPPAPMAEAQPMFQPLRPPTKSRVPLVAPATRDKSLSPVPSPAAKEDMVMRSPSSLTFGSRSESPGPRSASPLGGPVFKKQAHVRQRSSLIPSEAVPEIERNSKRESLPLEPEVKRGLGMTGTMGEGYTPAEVDVSDPDSDIPDELQNILSGHSDEESTAGLERGATPVSPRGTPVLPLPTSPTDTATSEDAPVFRARLVDSNAHSADLDEGHSSEDDTKKSFDFTGELKKLNESGASDRRSFVEQLENAFRTPAKVDLLHGFGKTLNNGLLGVDAPPVPKLPVSLTEQSQDSSSSNSTREGDMYSSVSRIIDVSMPPGLAATDSVDSGKAIRETGSSRELDSKSSTDTPSSEGRLNTSFKFGGRPTAPVPGQRRKDDYPANLSDVLRPPTSSSEHSSSSEIEDNSVLRSIYAKAEDIPQIQPREGVDCDVDAKIAARASRISRASSRPSSIASFQGFESFAEVRRGFEFHDQRPAFYPPPAAVNNSSRRRHIPQESMFSIASISSVGSVIHPGEPDPFDFGMQRLPERPSSENLSISMSTLDDTFSFVHKGRRRQRVDSDSSSFYFKPSKPPSMIQPYKNRAGHRQRDSVASTGSMAVPPISLYNRSFAGHRRNDSSTSASSVAMSYALHGASTGRAIWARHRQDASMDSVSSDFSAIRLGRPGLGDKMLDSGLERGMPLTAITASPSESVASDRMANRTSYDSILDERRSSSEDSLFERTGQRHSTSSESVFGHGSQASRQNLKLPNQLSRMSTSSSDNTGHSPRRDDDTMLTMFDGGHIRRQSVGSVYDASPCVRVEKRKHSVFQVVDSDEPAPALGPKSNPSPKTHVVQQPSIASTSSSKFGGERMIKAKKGLLERNSLEASALVAEGEDNSVSFHVQPVFTRPGPGNRSRSSTCTTSSSGVETPPLSISDGNSSQSEGSQSSVDLSHVNAILANTTHPLSSQAWDARTRTRTRGQGHRRRMSAHMSRSSVYETIEEELSSASPSVAASPTKDLNVSQSSKKTSSPTVREAVFVVDHENAPDSIWNDERGVMALRKYYALRDEAQNTVVESQMVWPNTPFSLYALQSFIPPLHPTAMQALLEHSVQNYGPLPSELRPHRVRSRTSSRVSPYPQARASKSSISSTEKSRPALITRRSFAGESPLQQRPVNANVLSPVKQDANKLQSPFVLQPEDLKRQEVVGPSLPPRPRVPSSARRTALGWSKRSTGKSSTGLKENANQGQGASFMMTPGESLRISRPRPRGRPTPARPARA